MSSKWDVGYIINKQASYTPDKTAVVYEDISVTYAQLDKRINKCMRILLQYDLKPSDRVAVLMLNCLEFIEIYFAVARLGLIFVPLNWRLPILYQLDDSGSKMVIFHDVFTKEIESIRHQLKIDEDKFIIVSSTTNAPVKCPKWANEYQLLIKDKPSDKPTGNHCVEFDDPLAIVYTSGVTGDPKGVVLSHQQTYFKVFQIVRYTCAGKDDVIIAHLPLFHSAGLFIVLTPALACGAKLILRQGFDPNQLADDIEAYRGTIVFALTSMWRMILESKKLESIDISSVRCVFGGGEKTQASLIKALAEKGIHMQQGYGQTENSAMTLVPLEDIHRKAGSVGIPGFFTDVWIQDKDGKILPPGEIGEIVARGPTVMSCYWNRPDETQKVLKNGVLHTGDLGYMDEEGYLYFVDRTNDMYISGGEKVYPAEVEKILSNHPKIKAVAIIGVPDEKWGETGIAFIILKENADLSEHDIKAFLGQRLSPYKHPALIKFVEKLPLTGTWKVRKQALRCQLLENKSDNT